MIQSRYGNFSIRTFLNTNIRHEWKKDAETDGVAPLRDPWLRGLSKMKWSVQTIAMASIALEPFIMRRADFVRRLKERSRQLRRGLEFYDQVIWPIVIRAGDSMPKDGYCRYTTLETIGVKRTLAYVGH